MAKDSFLFFTMWYLRRQDYRGGPCVVFTREAISFSKYAFGGIGLWIILLYHRGIMGNDAGVVKILFRLRCLHSSIINTRYG